MEAGGLAPQKLIQSTISLEMHLTSQVYCIFPSFPIFEGFCLFVDL
jgi:hypothetical protein